MDKTTAFQQMNQTFDALKAMPKSEWEATCKNLEVIKVPKKHVLQEIGKPSTVHYFVLEGLVRYYYLGLDGKEHNKAFYDKGHIVGSLSAIILNEPARYCIETIEPCTLIALPLNSSVSLELFNYGCQMMLVRNERREAELLTMSAKERFLQFHRNFPSYFDRIPQYQIASYLGITPVALSRYKEQWLEEQS
jgi:CRP-like cAMP-binding protein